jgi:hypothetical protein
LFDLLSFFGSVEFFGPVEFFGLNARTNVFIQYSVFSILFPTAQNLKTMITLKFDANTNLS